MGERGDFYIHNFPTHSARADRIEELLGNGRNFSIADFEQMQLDLKDLRAANIVPDLVDLLAESDDPKLRKAKQLLQDWDYNATVDSAAACLYYPFLDRFWPRRFMRNVLKNKLLNAIPAGAPGLNRFDIADFLSPMSPWQHHRDAMVAEITQTMVGVYDDVVKELGEHPDRWRWGDLHQIQFKHSLAKYEPWAHMQFGPAPIGGSPTTLGMATHMGPGPGRGQPGDVPCRVYHGPAYRLVVDLADPDHASFVIASGNGGKPDSPYVSNHFDTWLAGEFFKLSLPRAELQVDQQWLINQ
jgi:penicillin amidase